MFPAVAELKALCLRDPKSLPLILERTSHVSEFGIRYCRTGIFSSKLGPRHRSVLKRSTFEVWTGSPGEVARQTDLGEEKMHAGI